MIESQQTKARLRAGTLFIAGLACFLCLLLSNEITTYADSGSTGIIFFDENEVMAIMENDLKPHAQKSGTDPKSGVDVKQILPLLRTPKISASSGSAAVPTAEVKTPKMTAVTGAGTGKSNPTRTVKGSSSAESKRTERQVEARFDNKSDEIASGHLDPNVVSQVINSRLGGVKACYSSALMESPNLSGRLYVQFTINTDGSVGNAQSIDDSFNRPKLERCILTHVRSWRFPPPANGAVTVRHPFIFEQTY